MSQELAEHINKYKDTPLYKTFHSYHSSNDEEERLVFNPITPKKKEMASDKEQKTEQPVNNKNLEFAKSLAENSSINTDMKQATPLTSKDEEAITDKTPQNQSFNKKEVKHDIIKPNESNNRPVQEVKPTATPLVHRPATSGIASTPSDTSVSIPRNTTAESYGGPGVSKTNTATVKKPSLPTHSESITIPTREPNAQEKLNNKTNSSLETEKATDSPLKEKTNTDERTTEVAREPITPKKKLQNKNSESKQTQPTATSKVKPSNEDKETNNLLMDVLKKKATSKPAQRTDSYEQIKKAGEDINFIEKSHRLELAFKQDLAKIPLKQLNVYNIEDQSKSFIPFNTSLFNVLGSVVVGKSMYILFIFRNGKNIAIAPENWAVNEKEMTIKNGFQFFYKEKEIDFNKLTETLKIMAGSVTPTNDYTEFWLKYMPAIDANE